MPGYGIFDGGANSPMEITSFLMLSFIPFTSLTNRCILDGLSIVRCEFYGKAKIVTHAECWSPFWISNENFNWRHRWNIKIVETHTLIRFYVDFAWVLIGFGKSIEFVKVTFGIVSFLYIVAKLDQWSGEESCFERMKWII